MAANHGGAFVTPNTEYVIEAGQYAAPLDGSYAPLSEYEEKYRGASPSGSSTATRAASTSRVLRDRAAALLAGLCRTPARARPTAGSFCNTLQQRDGDRRDHEGQPAVRGRRSANDMDYMHIINWQAAAEVRRSRQDGRDPGTAGSYRSRQPSRRACSTSLREPKSPHGVDVTPERTEIIVSGKLDPHATVYSFEKIQQAIASEDYSGTDPYGVPILTSTRSSTARWSSVWGRCTRSSTANGIAYTSLFLEPSVVKWNYETMEVDREAARPLQRRTPVGGRGRHESPDGNYLVAMNKWAIDRFTPSARCCRRTSS